MAALMRCKFLKYHNLGQSVIRVLSVSNKYGIIGTSTSNRSAVTAAKDRDSLLNEVHRKIDMNIGVSNELFQSLYSSFEKHDSLTDMNVALLLHICSTGPFDSPASKRSQTADEIWNKMEQLGIPLSTKLYNIKLKVYVANKTPFSPLDELMKMKSLGLNPDKVTYGLLLEAFCQQGDIAAANNVLEAMKGAEYLIGIGVFNSFITGHLKAGSPEEAANVVEVLRSRGLEPNADTYSRFALHYAEEGDIESVLKYVNQAESGGVLLNQTMLLDIYRTMVTSGHSNKAAPLLQIISEKGIFRSASVQKSCQLASEGHIDAALQLYTILPRMDDEKVQYNTGSFLLKAMIINGQSAEAVMNTSDKIVEHNVKALPHRNALLYAYKAGHTDLAVELLELMKARNHEIKVPHIAPAICSYRKSQNKEGLYRVIRMLLELDGKECIEDKADILIKFAYPALDALKQSREDIVQNFQEYEKVWNLVFFVNDLAKSCTTALENAAGKTLDTSLLQWQDMDEHLVSKLQKDWQSCVNVLEFLDQQGLRGGMLLSLNASAVSHLAQNKDWGLVEKILTAMQEKNLRLRTGVKQLRFYSEAPKTVQTKIDQLSRSQGFTPNSGHHYLPLEKLDAMSVEELEAYQKEKPGSNLARVAFLKKALDTSDINNIKQKLREMETTGFKVGLIQLMRAVNKFTELGDVEAALHYFEEVKKTVGNNYRAEIPLTIGIEQVKTGNIAGAVQMIRAAGESTFPMDDRRGNRKLWALKEMLKVSPTLDDALNLHSEIFKNTSLVLDSENLQVHAAYITRVMTEDNDSELITQLTKLNEAYRVFPCLERVLVRFINKQDVDRLKKVMDLGISTFGSSNFHIRLAISFIECGMISKAATVLQTPGLKFQERFILNACQYFLKSKKIDCLESLVNLTKDLPVSRAHMLKYLLEGYVAVDKLSKAMEVLDQFNENFITPPKEVVDLLVKAHLSHGMAIPEPLQAYTSNTAEASSTVQTSSSGSESDSESSASEIEEINTKDGEDSAKEDRKELKEQKNSEKPDAKLSDSSKLDNAPAS